MSPLISRERDTPDRFPRVSGDEPRRAGMPRHIAAFSPRERG